MHSQIFVSYRRDDSSEITKRIYEQLVENFGKLNTFIDIGSIKSGENFATKLHDALAECEVVIVVIGTEWEGKDSKTGKRRIDDPGDYVYQEVAGALNRTIRVIPALVGGASIPNPDNLPAGLKHLSGRNAITIRDNTFDKDVEKLVKEIDRFISDNSQSERSKDVGDRINEFGKQLDDFQKQVKDGLSEILPAIKSSLYLVSKERRGYDAYYDWVLSNHQEKDAEVLQLFLAGRSVLHRIEEDIEERTKKVSAEPLKIENIVTDKLVHGAEIRVLFLDPRWSPFIEQFAQDEDQPYVKMLGDLARSVAICKRLYDNLLVVSTEENTNKKVKFPRDTYLDIRIYKQIPYFAYHSHDKRLIVGFYFSERGVGYQSSAFEVRDESTQRLFHDHFHNILDKSQYIIRISRSRGQLEFNAALYEDLYGFFSKHLPDDDMKKLPEP